MISPSTIRVIGVHRFVPTDAVVQGTLDAQWGSGISGADLDRARSEVLEHFQRLYVVEIEVNPPGANVNWTEITQPITGIPSSDWQVPYDERCLDHEGRRWAFFFHYFHYLEVSERLLTPLGPIALPAETPLPDHLRDLEYTSP